MPAGAPKYVVQQAQRKGWTTLAVSPDPAIAEAEFDDAVRHRPRSFFRLIQLQSSTSLQEDVFDWRLVRLHDPRQAAAGGPSRVTPAPAAPAAATPARASAAKARPAAGGRRRGVTAGVKPLPLRFYLACIGLGGVAVAAVLLLGR
ncbi:MAG: hypothetical protein P4M00_22665 [Azospirillaceae bacterium]|nr:hypothetical protein [Azospirillaceae bacterium]